MICNECETVAHCTSHGCIPKNQALDKMAENARGLGLDYKQPTGKLSAFNFKPHYNISFNHNGKQVGVLAFNGPEMTFSGDMDESAKVFLEFIAKAFKGRLEQERTEALAQQPAPVQQEPVGEAYLCDKCHTPFDGCWYCPECNHNTATKELVYTSPPAQRTWVGLTDEEIISMSRYDLEYAALIGEVQRKLKEKNSD